MREVVWSGKPYMRKTVVKFLLLFTLSTVLLIWLWSAVPTLFLLYVVSALLSFAFYYYWKNAHTYYVTPNSVLISRSWVFGTYQREITLDKIQDVHVQQGLLARAFDCGSLVFVTTTGYEIGYTYAGVGRGVVVATGKPRVRRTASNAFLDIRSPVSVREIIMKGLVAWREAFQQQRIASAVERMVGKEAEEVPAPSKPSIADELLKLKRLLDEGLITKEEYEKLKKRIVEGAA
ncbi:MAG: PH domain-containing protein [Thermofilaceae archaeon]